MGNIYFIKFKDGLRMDDEHPIYQDFLNLLDKGDDKCIGFTDKEDIFISLNLYKLNRLLSLFTKHGFIFEVTDVTNDVISGYIQKKYPEVEKLTPGIFENFRIENTSVDDVLDKILKSGINSLDKLDNLILSHV